MNQEDYQALRQDYINQIVTVAKKHIPYFKFLEDISAGTTTKTGENHKKTTVIPLETVLKNVLCGCRRHFRQLRDNSAWKQHSMQQEKK